MKLVKIKQSFFDMFDDPELLKTKAGRPCVLLVSLSYKGKLRDFVVPLRSNISPYTDVSEYKSLPPNKNTNPGYHHGVHYIKLFPVDKKYVDTYLISNNPYLLTIKSILDKKETTKEIVDACQNYLNEYESGNKHPFSPDIDNIINTLDS